MITKDEIRTTLSDIRFYYAISSAFKPDFVQVIIILNENKEIAK